VSLRGVAIVLPALLVVPLVGCAKKAPPAKEREAAVRDGGGGGTTESGADDCAAAVANMKRVVPDLVAGDDADRQDCLAMPHEVVMCLKTVKTPAGTYKTVRYEAYLFNDVIYRRSGRLYIWLTDDRRRLPVQVQVRLHLAIGTITLQLEKEEKT